MAQAAAAIANTDSSLNIERMVDGNITCLRFVGTINEQFEGKKLASTVKSDTVLVHLGDVKRISSFGLREWSDFVATLEKTCEAIIAVECPPKIVDQLNMVNQFLGKRGWVFSLHAPYRCDYCDTENRTVLQVDRDHVAIRTGNPPERICELCSRPQYFDEDPAAFFSYMAAQPNPTIAPNVADFLASKLKYSVTGGDRRLQIDKHVENKNTYLKLTGNLDGSFPSSKLADGLEGTVVIDVAGVGTVDLAGAAEWRNFVTSAKSLAQKFFVVGCPPILLERLSRPGDLGDAVLSIQLPYSCGSCSTTSSHNIDVQEHLDVLKLATPPEAKCPQCKASVRCVAPDSLLSKLRSLPEHAIDAPLKKFIKESRERKPAKVAEANPGKGKNLAIILGMASTALAVAAVVTVMSGGKKTDSITSEKLLKTNEKLEQATKQLNELVSEVPRPAWVRGDTPLTAYCAELVAGAGLQCVGVSAFEPDKETAQKEAADAALEEALAQIALRVEDKDFTSSVKKTYEDARSKAFEELAKQVTNPNTPEFKQAADKIRSVRQLVVEHLYKTGGAAVPAQQSTWHWEEYKKHTGDGSEFLVFVRFDISSDALKTLIREYTQPISIAGAKVVTAFPLLVWRNSEAKNSRAVVLAAGKSAWKEGDVLVVPEADDKVRTASDLEQAGTTPSVLKM